MRKQVADCNDPDDRDERGDDGWQDLAVVNPTFLLERLGAECGDLEFLRELTVNGLDAIAAHPHPAGGRVIWDLDWQRSEAPGGRVRKLTVTDTGTGMRPDQLGRYINQLASSSREQSHTANFGVGAKVRGRFAQPPRPRIPLLAPRPRRAGPVQTTSGRPLGPGTPALARRPPRLLAAADRR